VSGKLDSNEWLIRELESYDCPGNWAYCSDIAMRAATALHLAEDIIEAKNAEMERLRAEVERLTDELQQVANEIALAESQEARRG